MKSLLINSNGKVQKASSLQYLMGKAEYIGAFPIRQEIEILSADPKPIRAVNDHLKINSSGKARNKITQPFGWTFQEKIGIAIINPRGIIKASKSISVGK